MQNAMVPLFPVVYVQTAQPVPSTKVEASSMIANTILMTYGFTGGLIYRPMRHVTLRSNNYDGNTYYWSVTGVFATYS